MVMLLRQYKDGWAKGDSGYTSKDELASTYIKPVAYDPETTLFYNNDQSIGFMLECHPIPGRSGDTHGKVDSLLDMDWPDETIVSFMLYRSPDIQGFIDNLWDVRKKQMHDTFTADFLTDQTSWLKKHTVEPLQVGSSYVRLHDTKVYFTAKFAIDLDNASEKYVRSLCTLLDQCRSQLEEIGMNPQSVDAVRYKRLMKTMFHWGEDAPWRKEIVRWDASEELCNQILDLDTAIDVGQDGLRIGNDCKGGGKVNVQTFAVKDSPEYQHFGSTLNFIGETFRQSRPIMSNYAITTNIYFQSRGTLEKSFQFAHKLIQTQAANKMVGKIPSILYKNEQFKELTRAMERHRPVKMATTALLFTYDHEEMVSAKQKFTNLARSMGYHFVPDVYKAWPSFVNSLPMCAEVGAVRMLGYYRTMCTIHATVQLPIFGEWKGHYHMPHMTLVGRNGQIMGWTLHSEELAHFITTAGSGSGKSFKVNEMVTSYYSAGAKIWILDRGGSYLNTCKVLGGNYIDFDVNAREVDYSFNPFASVNPSEYASEKDEIASILKAMIFWHDDVTDTKSAILDRAIDSAWERSGNNATVTDVAMILNAEFGHEGQAMSQIMHRFTENGSDGKWFLGNKRPPWGEKLSVIETSNLTSLNPQLRIIILMAILSQIRGSMYNPKERDRVKALMVDEAWSMLSEPLMGMFFEVLAREARKYNGLLGLITQTPGELKQTPNSQAIIAQAATKHVLRMEDTGIEQAREMKYLGESELVYDLLRTQTTVSKPIGGFSEIYIKSLVGEGLGRLVVSPLRGAMYSSTAADAKFMRDRYDEGMSVMDALRMLMAKRQGTNHEGDQ